MGGKKVIMSGTTLIGTIMKKAYFWLILLILPIKVHAMCPVCTAAALAGVGLSRWLHIDDTISGVWIGALVISSTLWTINWLGSKKVIFPLRGPLIAIIYYASVLLPFWQTDIIGHPKNVFFGIDKLLLGIAVGSIFFYLGYLFYEKIKADNDGHAQFPFQKLALSLGPLLILSVLFYFVTKYIKVY